MKRRFLSLSVAATFTLSATTFVDTAQAQNKYNNQAACSPGIRTGSPGTKHVMKHPVVSLIFWGDEWPSPPGAGAATAGQITGALQDLMAGPYFTWLSQYGGAGSPRLFASVLYKNDEPAPTKFITNDVANLIKGQLGKTVPQATSTEDNLYYVLLPPGSSLDIPRDKTGCATQESALNYGGCHAYDTAPNGQRFYFAWTIANGLGDIDIISHELVEAIAEPDLNWNLGNGDEIGDVCEQKFGMECMREVDVPANQQPWYFYQGYYSVQDHRCLTPYTWQNVYRWAVPDPGCNGHPNCWTQVNSNVHTFTSGGFFASGHSRVYADVNGLWLHYSDQASDINLGQGVFSMVAVSDRAVYGLAWDQTSIFQWTPANGWLAVGQQATSIYAGSKGLVAVQANDLAKGGGSGSFFLDDSTNTWSRIDTVPVSMFAVNGDGVYELQANPNEIWKYNNGWIKMTASPSVDITASVGLLARLGASPRSTYTVWTNGTNWFQQTPMEPYDIAVANNNLFWMSPDRSDIYQSMNVAATNPNFTDLGQNGRMFRGSTTNFFVGSMWTTD